MIEKIEITQDNYPKILEVAKVSNSKTDLCNRLGYYKDGRRLEILTNLLKANNFDFSAFLNLSKRNLSSAFNDNEKLSNIVKISKTYTEVCKSFNLKPTSSNFITLKDYIKLFKIDISHFDHSRKFLPDNFEKYYKTEELFVQNSTASTNTAKRRILKEKLKEYKCLECGNPGIWRGKKISLQLEHINGNNKDHRLENLCFLCPNCHATTSTWCGKNIINKSRSIKEISTQKTRMFENNKGIILTSYIIENNSLKEILTRLGLVNSGKNCQALKQFLTSNKTPQVEEFLQRSSKKSITYPPVDVLLERVKQQGFVQVGKSLGCSDNAVKKYLKKHGVDTKNIK